MAMHGYAVDAIHPKNREIYTFFTYTHHNVVHSMYLLLKNCRPKIEEK